VIDCKPAGLALQLSEKVVLVRALGPVELAELAGAFDATSGGLVNVNVRVAIIGRVLFAV
jgi:hypothetical protein